MNLLILDAGHAKNTAGKNNAKENFYEWEFNNDMQYKIKARCEDLGIKVFLTNPNPQSVSDLTPLSFEAGSNFFITDTILSFKTLAKFFDVEEALLA